LFGYVVFLHNAYANCRSYRTCCHSKFGLETLTQHSSGSKRGPVSPSGHVNSQYNR